MYLSTLRLRVIKKKKDGSKAHLARAELVLAVLEDGDADDGGHHGAVFHLVQTLRFTFWHFWSAEPSFLFLMVFARV